MKDESRSNITDNGEQYVMMDGMTRMHKLSVINFSFASKNNVRIHQKSVRVG